MATSGHTDDIGDYLVEVGSKTLLGKGTYGKVYLGKHVRTGRRVAVKLMEADKECVTEETEREAKAMMSIPDHENVLKMHDVIKKEVEALNGRIYINYYLVLELCPLGSLVDYVAKTSMSLIHKLELMMHGNHGLLHLHNLQPKNVVHRDIKPSNMLISGDSNRVVLKIGDFGEVKMIEQSKMMESVRGTQPYWAPEMFSSIVGDGNPTYNKSVDVFAKGMSDLALLDCEDRKRMKAKKLNDEELGLHLYRNKDKTVQYSIEEETDSEDVKQVKILIKLMIAQKSSDRPSIQEVVENLDYMLATLRAKMLQKNPPALFAKLRLPGEASGATAQPPTGSTRGASSIAVQPEPLPIREVSEGLSGLDVRAATRDIVLAVNTGGQGRKRALWILIGDQWEEHPIPAEIPTVGVCFAGVHGGVMAMGGYGYPTNSAKCYFFSLSTKQWSELADMITPRYYSSAVEIREKVVMAVGGLVNKHNATAVCEILDIERNERAPGLAMSKGLVRPRVAVLAGRAYVLPRGSNKHGEKTYTRNLEEINTEEKSITQKAPLTHSRENYSLGLVGLAGNLYFFSVDEAKRDQGYCSQYDPVSDVWSVQETRYSLSYRRPDHCAAVVRDEKILLCGGDEARSAVAEYTMESNQWRILSTRLPFEYDWWKSHAVTANVRE